MREWRTLLGELIGQARSSKGRSSDRARLNWRPSSGMSKGLRLRMKIEHTSQLLKDAVQLMLDHFRVLSLSSQPFFNRSPSGETTWQTKPLPLVPASQAGSH